MVNRQIDSLETYYDFISAPPEYHKRRQSITQPDILDIETDPTELYAGIAISKRENKIEVGIAIHDGTYSVDFAIHRIYLAENSDIEEKRQMIEDHLISSLDKYRKKHVCKLLGAGLIVELDSVSPNLCARLWSELDIVPIICKSNAILDQDAPPPNVDELADSAARKCLDVFGPTKQPHISIGYRKMVQIDMAGRIQLTTTDDYQRSVHEKTWRAVQKYVKEVRNRNIRIAFFSATPQGQDVASMRHALLRFLHCEGVYVEWFVPKPRPEIFGIMRTIHEILQGTVGPETYIKDEQLQEIEDWIIANAERYWLTEKGPLKAPHEGGADFIVVDDLHMQELIRIAKKKDLKRPVIFRNHIGGIRDDLVQKDGSAAQQVWRSMWACIKRADIFVSHPVRSYAPGDVPAAEVALLPATTDWLDGLNKEMQDWDIKYNLHAFSLICRDQGLPQLAYPKRPYIIAHFYTSNGISDVIKSYAKFRERFIVVPVKQIPQLVICGHSLIEDPNELMIHDQTISLINGYFSQYKDDIIVVRLGPSDQMLNAIMSLSTVALQLSTQEGFEVKVSEALHKGKPVIATSTDGNQLQIENGRNGYLVPPGDHDAVAKHLYDLTTNKELYRKISLYARDHVSDEVSTVGNALSWLYLASSMTRGQRLQPKGRWVNDLAREAVNEPYSENEPRLPRHLSAHNVEADERSQLKTPGYS